MKYRIWYKKDNCFIDTNNNKNYTECFSLTRNGNILKLKCFDLCKSDSNQWFIDKIDQNDYIVQLYSGIVDTDNKEIYEGDIIEVTHKIHIGENGKYICNLKKYADDEGFGTNDHFGFIIINITNEYHRITTPDLKSCNYTYKIIGNICENPELLK